MLVARTMMCEKTNQVPSGVPLVEKAEVTIAFEKLRATITNFESVVNQHICRLEPVLLKLAEEEKDKPRHEPAVPSCAVVHEILEHTRNLQNIAQRLAAATESLEI